MSTPQQPTKAPRRSARKQNNTPNGPHSRAAVSDNELSQSQLSATPAKIHGDPPQSRRKSQVPNKNTNNIPHRGSVSDSMQQEKTKATPIKQAYAGPTFHQSPAASALPIPSFYSKSVPNVLPRPSQAIPEHSEEEHHSTGPLADTPINISKDTTPLDFLFDAARQARGTPRGESPGTLSGHLSARNGSPASKSPAPKDPESMFPFELDGASTPGEDGPLVATPYRDRIEALRTSRPSSDGSQKLDESERRAKTDALKKFLVKNTGPQDANGIDLNNPFNARTPTSPNHLNTPPSQIRQRSGPSTPSYMQTYGGFGRSEQYFPQMAHHSSADANHYAAARVTSHLRNVYGPVSEPEPAELSSDSALSPPRISPARNPSHHTSPPPTNFPGQLGSVTGQTPPRKTAPSVQQMEEDLRRVLKLDLAGRG